MTDFDFLSDTATKQPIASSRGLSLGSIVLLVGVVRVARVVLDVTSIDTVTGAKAFTDEFSQTYLNGLDISTKISALYAIQGVPETFIIDRDGNIGAFIIQPIDEPGLTAHLENVLGAA